MKTERSGADNDQHDWKREVRKDGAATRDGCDEIGGRGDADGRLCSAGHNVIFGSNVDEETIIGTDQADTIFGLGCIDYIYAGGGIDVVCSGSGND